MRGSVLGLFSLRRLITLVLKQKTYIVNITLLPLLDITTDKATESKKLILISNKATFIIFIYFIKKSRSYY